MLLRTRRGSDKRATSVSYETITCARAVAKLVEIGSGALSAMSTQTIRRWRAWRPRHRRNIARTLKRCIRQAMQRTSFRGLLLGETRAPARTFRTLGGFKQHSGMADLDPPGKSRSPIMADSPCSAPCCGRIHPDSSWALALAPDDSCLAKLGLGFWDYVGARPNVPGAGSSRPPELILAKAGSL